MNDLKLIQDLRSSTPAITPESERSARAALLAAMTASAPVPRRRVLPRLALAGGLAVTIAAGLTVAQNVDTGQGISSVAGAADLAERAARAAETEPPTTGRPGQWLYLRERAAPLRRGGPAAGVDTGRRTTSEEWTSLDGAKVAWGTGHGRTMTASAFPGLSSADLAPLAGHPERLLAKIRAVLRSPRSAVTSHGDEAVAAIGPGVRVSTVGDPYDPDEDLFIAVARLMGYQVLGPAVRAGLFRALPRIPGVVLDPDAVDAVGRHGVAFSYGRSWIRRELILDPGTYRYLGTRGVVVRDHTVEFLDTEDHYTAGTVLEWTALMASRIVDKAGRRT